MTRWRATHSALLSSRVLIWCWVARSSSLPVTSSSICGERSRSGRLALRRSLALGTRTGRSSGRSRPYWRGPESPRSKLRAGRSSRSSCAVRPPGCRKACGCRRRCRACGHGHPPKLRCAVALSRGTITIRLAVTIATTAVRLSVAWYAPRTKTARFPPPSRGARSPYGLRHRHHRCTAYGHWYHRHQSCAPRHPHADHDHHTAYARHHRCTAYGH